MAASLPASVAPDWTATGGARARSATAVQLPLVRLPLAFMMAGVSALWVSAVWITSKPAILATYHYNQSVIAATHLFVLGWLGSVVMGAMYQLVPVALETTLYSRRLAVTQLGCHLVGMAGMVWAFRAWNLKQVGHFGSVLALGVGLFVYNILRTVLRAPKWTVTASAILAALGWLCLGVAVGLGITAGKCAYAGLDGDAAPGGVNAWSHGVQAVGSFMHRFDAIRTMHAHAHLGVIGFFTLLIVGVSYKLIPMFTLSEIRNPLRAAASVVFLNVGLAGTFLAVLLRSSWRLGGAAVVIFGLALYGLELRAVLRARKRRVLDWGIKTFLSAVGILAPLSILALVLSWPGLPGNVLTGRLENLYGFLGLAGMVSLAIIGMLYKIVPFLVWYGIYSKQVGFFKVPSLGEMYSERLQMLSFGAYLAGLAVVSAGILSARGGIVSAGGLLLVSGVSCLALNLGVVLSHHFRPRLQPLAGLKTRDYE